MLTEEQKHVLLEGSRQWDILLAPEVVEKFSRFAEMLTEANKTLNLTRIPPEQYVPLHFLDSLSLASVHNPSPGDTLLDVGTGAGFPGLPLALAYPQLQVTLMDGTRKRLAFLDSVIVEMGLTNVRTLHGRAEEVARQPEYSGHFDLVTARAVARLPQLARWLLPFVRTNGLAIAYKSREAADEIEESRPLLKELGATILRAQDIQLPRSEALRTLIVLQKLPVKTSPRSPKWRR